MTVTANHLQPGAKWTFVHRNGDRTEYVYDRVLMGASADLVALHALLNPVTGKEAMVTEKWLREPQVFGRFALAADSGSADDGGSRMTDVPLLPRSDEAAIADAIRDVIRTEIGSATLRDATVDRIVSRVLTRLRERP